MLTALVAVLPLFVAYQVGILLTGGVRNGVDFVSGTPRLDGAAFSAGERLFSAQSPGTRLTRVATQLDMLLSGGQDGGLFIMIGKKRAGRPSPASD